VRRDQADCPPDGFSQQQARNILRTEERNAQAEPFQPPFPEQIVPVMDRELTVILHEIISAADFAVPSGVRLRMITQQPAKAVN
jgi:hypothetical protein